VKDFRDDPGPCRVHERLDDEQLLLSLAFKLQSTKRIVHKVVSQDLPEILSNAALY